MSFDGGTLSGLLSEGSSPQQPPFHLQLSHQKHPQRLPDAAESAAPMLRTISFTGLGASGGLGVRFWFHAGLSHTFKSRQQVPVHTSYSCFSWCKSAVLLAGRSRANLVSAGVTRTQQHLQRDGNLIKRASHPESPMEFKILGS